jgi:predicted nucleotidyltransferase
MEELSENIDVIRNLCQSHHVQSLFAFGSVTSEHFDANGYISLLVDIAESNPQSYTAHYFNLKIQLERLLDRPINLLEQQSLEDSLLKEQIEKTKVLIYAR